ncbi:hypothetical protein IFM89_024106 [Coptis chinensis]|uniref:Las1-like protein n=1 Tax=Coptis chinensis TaxID=261450 RepID=A0A835LMK9_9MAGN|nr:hypothetical protein IFM89_024106 [Coptis chinensis]
MESNNEEEEEEQVCYKACSMDKLGRVEFRKRISLLYLSRFHSTALTREDLNSDAMESEVILAMLHSMAIMRLVNGVAHKGRYETEGSIADKALEIGLPRMLVDLRHEASHRDLPSLRLVQLASVKALEWVKSYYWERQKNAILSQRDTIDFVRKKVKSKLHELAFYLNTNESSQLGSLPMKRKRSKQSSVILARFNLFSHTVKKLHGSQSQGPKKHITRILRKLFQLYTSSPSEVVAVLLDLLVKTFDSSNVVEPLHDSGVEQISGDSRTQTGLTNLFKLVITRLSSREPDLILIMLQAVFQTLERRDTMKYEIDKESLSCSQSKAEDLQIEQLSSLVLWLIEDYKRVKQHASSIVH